MGMSASQARFLSVTSRISDLGLRGQSIAEQRIRLSMDMEGIGKAYNQDISDRRLYMDTLQFSGNESYGKREFISYANLLEQGLYVYNGEKVLGYGEKQSVIGQETYISSYENDLTKPKGWEQKLVVVGQTDDLTKPIGWNKKEIDDLSNPIGWNKKTVTDYDNITKWSQKEVPGEPIHHPAGYTNVNQVTTFGEPKTNASVVKGETLPAMQSIVASTGLGTDDLKVVSYQTPINGKMKTVNSVAIRSQEGFDAVMQKLAAGDATALKQNYVLDLGADSKIDMSAYKNWSGINNFSGMFDGNMYTIENINGSQGLFASNSGVIQNVYLNNVNINNQNANHVGGLAGVSSGVVQGCKISNINMNVGTSSSMGGLIGTLQYGGSVDRSSVQGKINISGNDNWATAGLVGEGSGKSITKSFTDVDITLPNGYNNTYCVNTFLGHDDSNLKIENSYSIGSIKYQNGQHMKPSSGSNSGFGHNSSQADTSYTMQNGVPKFWNDPGSVRFDSGQNSPNVDKNKFKNEAITTSTGVNIPVWLFPGDAGYADQGQDKAVSKGLPVLNLAAMNIAETDAWDEATTKLVNDEAIEWGTKEVDDLTDPISWEKKTVDDLTSPNAWDKKNVMGYVDDKTKPNAWEQKPVYSERDVYGPVMDMDKEVIGLTAENLEYGIRSGKLQLFKLADENSTSVKEFGNTKFERVNWQTCTVISDDLYKDNDAQAQAKYEVEMKKLQTKDKRLELEQKNVDTEYKALTTEHDSIKKVIDKNIETSFKMFG